jgi:hypothetical protein
VGIVKNLYVGANTNIAGTLGVTGVATFSAAPIYSSLTASSAVATDASKALVSVTNTGTGNNVLATSPTLVTPILGTPTSGVAPAGFTNSALITVTTADASIGSTQVYVGAQAIEGFNVADFAWGTASASVVTLSFWVRSSLTGTFSGSVKNSDGTRSYPFTYSIASADTLEYKTVTIPGDTTGTWLTNNGIGIGLTFNLGSGSSRLGTASTWAAANYDGATGSVALISTLNATWYVTGVQLEKGSTATSFDYRPYGTELGALHRGTTPNFLLYLVSM